MSSPLKKRPMWRPRASSKNPRSARERRGGLSRNFERRAGRQLFRCATTGGGTYTTLDDPLANNGTFAAEINNNSQIVGMYTDASNHGHGFLEITVPNPPPPAGTRERNSDRAKLLPPSAYVVLNFRDAAPPSPRGALANATPRRFPLRLITRNLSSGI